jgi:Uncharacterised nucleotidyltransferase
MTLDDDKNDYYWKLLQFEVQEKRIAQIFKIFKESKFEPVLIKGWAAARKYKQPFERISVDIDLAVKPADYVECKNFLERNNILGVDLHEGLRHLDNLLWEDLYEKTQLVEVGGVNIRILGDEDHLRVLCVHWLNDGGVNKERLWDIFYAVKNRADNFNWERCLESVGQKRQTWIIFALALTKKYLLLDLSETPTAVQNREIPEWITKTIEKEWQRGTKLKPLEECLINKIEFVKQLIIRIPPNPIQSTIEMDGELGGKLRIYYQLGGVLMRIKPSLIRLSRKIMGK